VSKKPSKTKLPQEKQPRIRPTQAKFPQGISFSFKYYDASHDDFTCDTKDASYWQTLVNRLKDLSSLAALDLRQSGSKTLRCHPIEWAKTNQNSFGLKNEEQLVVRLLRSALSSLR
jgi:hypothetical protein